MKIWSWRQGVLKSGLPAPTRHVLLTLSVYMNEVGEGCWPSVEQLVEDTGLGRSTLFKHLCAAEKAGWLKRRNGGVNGQGWLRNEYAACYPVDMSNGRIAVEENQTLDTQSSPPNGLEAEKAPENECHTVAKTHSIEKQQYGSPPNGLGGDSATLENPENIHAAPAKAVHYVDSNSSSIFNSVPACEARASHICEAPSVADSTQDGGGESEAVERIWHSEATVDAAPLEEAQQDMQAAPAPVPPTPSDAEKLVGLFDEALEAAYGQRREAVRSDDLIAAQVMLSSGATLELCRQVFLTSLKWMRSKDKQAPRGVRYFAKGVADEVRRANGAPATAAKPMLGPGDIAAPVGSQLPEEWGSIRQRLYERHGENIYRCWIAPLTVGAVADDRIVLDTPMLAAVGWLTQRMLPELEREWAAMNGRQRVEVRYVPPPP